MKSHLRTKRTKLIRLFEKMLDNVIEQHEAGLEADPTSPNTPESIDLRVDVWFNKSIVRIASNPNFKWNKI